MRVAVDFGCVYIAGNVVCGGLFRKYYGYAEICSRKAGYSDSRSFDCEYFGYACVFIKLIKFASEL